jgi:phenylalanyl-tRNA synthetase alpha chain
MKEQIEKIKADFASRLSSATDAAAIEELRVAFLGRKAGALTEVLRALPSLSEDERRHIGPLANALRQEIETTLNARETELSSEGSAPLDITLPGVTQPVGHLHLVSQAIEEITDIFSRIGFYRVRYPEVEWDWYAFESLNMPADHAARDEWETFFIDKAPVGPKGQRVLTPHTSSGQVREMERTKPPIRMINISKCYRRQADVSHAPMFHQFEGLLVDENVTISDFIGVWDYFVKSFFGPERKIRVRPYHFQFTEPSVELDVSCGVCDGKGCKLCKGGWLELGGGGMVHPNVLKAGKIDPKKYTGFAFGWGVERTYMMKAGLQIPDIRMLYQNDVRFLKQF